MKSFFKFSSSSGFACIELVVVVAMVLMLVVVKLAALGRADARTKTIQDLSNCKNIMAAMHLYTIENRDTLPRPGWGTAIDCWAAGNGNTSMTFAAPGSAANYPTVLTQQLHYVIRSQLWPYLKNEKLLMCPADGAGKDPSFYNRAEIVTSYVWNGAIIGYSGTTDFGTPIYRITHPRFKVDAVLQWEMYSAMPVAFNDFSSYPSEGISPRHGKYAPIAMFGGGAEMILYTRWYDNSPALRNVYNAFACCGTPGGTSLNTVPNRAWCSPNANGH